MKVKLANHDCCNPKTGSRKFEGYYTLSAECTISGGVGVGGQIDLPGMDGIELQWRWLRGELRRTYSATLDTCVKDSLILKDERKAGINIGMDFMAGLGDYVGVTPVADIAGYLEYEAEAHVVPKWVKIWLGFSGILKVGLQFNYAWYEGFWPLDPEFNGTPKDLPIFSHTFSL